MKNDVFVSDGGVIKENYRIELSNNNIEFEATVHNLIGIPIAKAANMNSIDLSNVESGMYFIVFQIKNHNPIIKKILVKHNLH